MLYAKRLWKSPAIDERPWKTVKMMTETSQVGRRPNFSANGTQVNKRVHKDWITFDSTGGLRSDAVLYDPRSNIRCRHEDGCIADEGEKND